MKLKGVIIFLALCLAFSLGASGTTRAYLREVPLEKMAGLYADKPEYAQFFKQHQPLFEKIIEREERYAEDYAIFYHGVNGQRLVFDTIEALYDLEHHRSIPAHFKLLRDPDDPRVATQDVLTTITERWPPLLPEEKLYLLTLVMGHAPPKVHVGLLWDVLWGDREFGYDLTPNEQQIVAKETDNRVSEYRHLLNEVGSADWQEMKLSDWEKRRVGEILARAEREGHGDLIQLLNYLEDTVDFTSDFRSRNLAVTLGLFSSCVGYDESEGLQATKDECALLYWFSPVLGSHRKQRNQDLRRQILVPILQRHGIPIQEIDKLEQIHAMLQPADDELLLQIMVPKSMVDGLFYLSRPVGRPAYYLGFVQPSKVLKEYQADPSHIPGFLQLQGRLLFTEEGLLNPDSGIRVVTYYLPGASKERIAAYKQQIKAWAKRQVSHGHARQRCPQQFGV